MRIGILLTGFDGGGAQRRLMTLAPEFLARGHAVDLVVGCEEGPFRAQVPEAAAIVPLRSRLAGVPGISRRKSLRMLAGLPSLVRYLRKGRADVLLCGSTPANLAALAARDIARSATPVVISVNVPLSRSTTARGRPALARLVRRFYPRSEAVIANAAFVAEDAATFAGVSRERVATIPNPVAVGDIRRLSAEPTLHPWFHDGDGPDDGVPLVLAVGKLKQQKDFPTLLRALRAVREVRPARLLVLGAGEHRERLMRLAGELDVAEHVMLAGFVTNPFAYMARADLLVSSSRWEGFSNVIAEALACGCPVVATDCPGGVAELLDDGRFGRLVDIGDHRSMARAMLDTLASPPDRERLRERAAEFSVGRAAEAYLDVLERVAA